jgi:acyl carrier protein
MTQRLALSDRIIDLVHRETSAPKDRIHLHSELGDDLGIDGADGWELIEAFAKEFEVDISEFQWDRYFGPEAGFNPILWLIQWAIGRLPKKLEPITIQNLVDAAERHKLV